MRKASVLTRGYRQCCAGPRGTMYNCAPAIAAEHNMLGVWMVSCDCWWDLAFAVPTAAAGQSGMHL